jgi:nucleoside-diphosphate-sugar epimerase
VPSHQGQVTCCGVPPRLEITVPVARQGGHGRSVCGSSALIGGASVPAGDRVRRMRVFLAGATGAIGRALLPKLLAAGHEVVGMTRSEERAGALREAGAEPVVCDVFDVDALTAAVTAARPEVVVNELTDIPQALDPRRFEEQMRGLERIRAEGYPNLVRAAQASGARRLVAQSIAFIYAPGEGAAPEDEPVWEDVPEPFATTLHATLAGERAVLDSGLEALVLRYGWWYGPGTAWAADGATTEMIRRRRFPIIGRGRGVSSYIHVDDAADATVAAVASDATGILNVVDDEPAELREWLPATARAIGAPKPLRVPTFVARLVAGRYAAAFSTRQRGASNARAKDALGWAPAHATWRGTLGT